jgi:hypothetical protein
MPQATWMAGLGLPGAGIADTLGLYPEDTSGSGEMLPSFGENIQNKQYLDALYQGLGLAGDVAYASTPLTGAIGILGGTALKGAGALGKASKATKAAKGLDYPAPRTKKELAETPVYHGTVRDPETGSGFEKGHEFFTEKYGGNIYGDAHYWTSNPRYASEYGGGTFSIEKMEILDDLKLNPKQWQKIAQEGHDWVPGGQVMPAHLKMKKPLDLTPQGQKTNPKAIDWYDDFFKARDKAHKKYGIELDDVDSRHFYLDDDSTLLDLDMELRHLYRGGEGRLRPKYKDHGNIIQDIYRDMGYDGIIMDPTELFPNLVNEGILPKGTLDYVVFEPEQIQSIFSKVTKKAHGGFVDKAIAGGERYI